MGCVCPEVSVKIKYADLLRSRIESIAQVINVVHSISSLLLYFCTLFLFIFDITPYYAAQEWPRKKIAVHSRNLLKHCLRINS